MHESTLCYALTKNLTFYGSIPLWVVLCLCSCPFLPVVDLVTRGQTKNQEQNKKQRQLHLCRLLSLQMMFSKTIESKHLRFSLLLCTMWQLLDNFGTISFFKGRYSELNCNPVKLHIFQADILKGGTRKRERHNPLKKNWYASFQYVVFLIINWEVHFKNMEKKLRHNLQ